MAVKRSWIDHERAWIGLKRPWIEVEGALIEVKRPLNGLNRAKIELKGAWIWVEKGFVAGNEGVTAPLLLPKGEDY